MSRDTRKTCRKCGTNKPLREFYRRSKSESRDGCYGVCIECERERNAERMRKAREENAEAKDTDNRCWKFGGPWVIVNDPDNSWGVRSSLTLQALRKLIELEYVCPGLRLRHEQTGRVATIVQKDGSLAMKYEGRESVKA